MSDGPESGVRNPEPHIELPATPVPSRSPQATIRAWLPHLVMLAMLGLAIWLVAEVFRPLRDPALLAASLAAMTYAIVFRPIHRQTVRLLPRLDEGWRRRVRATLATTAMIVLLISPVAALLINGVGLADTPEVLLGLALRDPDQVARVAELGVAQARATMAVYPDLPIDPDAVRVFLTEAFGRSRNQAVLDLMAKGDGGFLAQTVLAAIMLFAFYDQGPRIVRTLIAHAPLAEEQRQNLRRRFRHVVLHVLNQQVATALAKGLTMGFVAWCLIPGINLFLVVAAVATVLSLIPVVGYASVYLPLASLLWSQQYPMRAVGLVVAGVASGAVIGYLAERLTRNLDHHDDWMGFMLFLSLIGGLLSYGAKGLVIGPMAVVILAVLGGFWLPLYGVRDREVEAAQTP